MQPNVTGKRAIGGITETHGISRKALSIDQFCEAHGISRSFYFKLKAAGKGPVEMEVGARRLISDESAAAWRKQMEAA